MRRLTGIEELALAAANGFADEFEQALTLLARGEQRADGFDGLDKL